MIDGFTKLGNTLHGAMQSVAGANNTISADLGIINGDMSLTPDSFRQPIPKGDYLVDIMLTPNHGLEIETGGTHGGHTSGNGSHNHTIKNRVLKSGDRVVVIKVGTEYIVTNIVTSSSNI